MEDFIMQDKDVKTKLKKMYGWQIIEILYLILIIVTVNTLLMKVTFESIFWLAFGLFMTFYAKNRTLSLKIESTNKSNS